MKKYSILIVLLFFIASDSSAQIFNYIIYKKGWVSRDVATGINVLQIGETKDSVVSWGNTISFKTKKKYFIDFKTTKTANYDTIFYRLLCDVIISKDVFSNNNITFEKYDSTVIPTVLFRRQLDTVTRQFLFSIENSDSIKMDFTALPGFNDTLIQKNTHPDQIKFSYTKILDPEVATKRNLRNLFEQKRFMADKPFYRISLSYMPGIAFRSLKIANPIFNDNDRYSQRTLDGTRFGQAFQGSLGISLNKKGYLSLGLLYLMQGFNSDSKIDFATGFGTSPALVSRYSFQSIGLGLEYNYDGYGLKRVEPAFDLGMYWLIFTEQTGKADNDALNTSQLKNNSLALKLAFGCNYHFNYKWGLRFLPTLYYDLISVDKSTEIRSRLFNFGFSLSGVYKIRYSYFKK